MGKNYKTISENLFEIFPKFKSIFKTEEGNYLIFADFGKYLISKLDDEIEMKKIGQFISQYLGTSNKEIENLIIIELFHPIYGDDIKENKMINFLDKESQQKFLKYKNENNN